MFFLSFFVLLIQFLTYWIFEPLTFFLTNLLEVRLLPVIALLIFIVLFLSEENIQN